jgi:hypothetical protein
MESQQAGKAKRGHQKSQSGGHGAQERAFDRSYRSATVKSFVRIVASLIGVFALSLDAVAGSTPAVQIGPTGRYLVDQNNAPFMLVGDSPQAVIGNTSVAQADQYFADRQAHGFNAVWINLLCNSYTFCNADGTTFDGIAPFTSPGDLSMPNAAYFQRAHDIVAAAGARGLIVFLDPIETGGWLSVLQANGQTKANNYGTYVGNFFKDLTNILWLSGNDFRWQTASDNDLVREVAQAIKAVSPSQLHTIELNDLTSSLDDVAWAATISLNAAYTYSPTYAEVLHAYNQSSAIPTFMIEANYEYEHDPNTDGGQVPRYLRMQEYWTMLSGATGQFYGSCFTVQMSTPCRFSGQPSGSFFTVIDSPGVTQLQYMAGLFKALAWYNLVPDQTHSVVTIGYGNFSSSGLFAGNNYVTTARTPDGTLVMAYLPATTTITVDMTKMAGPTTARWFDPTNNTFSTVAGSPFANTGTRQFTSPAANSSGDPDFVLVLEASPRSHDFNGDGKSELPR